MGNFIIKLFTMIIAFLVEGSTNQSLVRWRKLLWHSPEALRFLENFIWAEAQPGWTKKDRERVKWKEAAGPQSPSILLAGSRLKVVLPVMKRERWLRAKLSAGAGRRATGRLFPGLDSNGLQNCFGSAPSSPPFPAILNGNACSC